MTPQPLEQGGAVTAFIPTGQEMAPRQNLIPLGRLIDFIIQRTYHELTVLAELKPKAKWAANLSTCSLNPNENEAVLLTEMVRQCLVPTLCLE
ncbi:hypothetical protein quinque_004288 [Culex quinquefasciatus]